MKRQTSEPMLNLFKRFCTVVSFDTTGYQSAYKEAAIHKNRMINYGGPTIIPHFSLYLKSLKEDKYQDINRPKYTELVPGKKKPRIDILEQCCIMLFCEVTKKYKINYDRHTPLNTFEKWLHWGENFDPDDTANYLE